MRAIYSESYNKYNLVLESNLGLSNCNVFAWKIVKTLQCLYIYAKRKVRKSREWEERSASYNKVSLQYVSPWKPVFPE